MDTITGNSLANKAEQVFDFVVLGSGIAGLTFALDVAAMGTVALVTKKDRTDSNTNWAQGGIAGVMAPDDSFDLHVQDTLIAGGGIVRRGGGACLGGGGAIPHPRTD